MRSPQTSVINFDELQYSLYIGLWMQIAKPLRDKYKINFADMRILCSIDGLTQLYGWRLNGLGISENQIRLTTGFSHIGVKNRLANLERLNYLSHTEEGKKRIIRRYKITKRGKEIVNDLSADREQVHERMEEYLYKARLLA